MTKKIRLTAIAAASVLGITLLSISQTGALWRAEGTLNGGTIHSGFLDLTVGSSGSTNKDYAFDAFGGEGLGEGQYAQSPLTIKNSGNVLMKYRLQNSAQSNEAMPLTLTVTRVDSEAECPAQGDLAADPIYSGNMIGAQAPMAPQWLTLDAGESEVLCLRGTVGANAPTGEDTTVQLSFAAESR